MKRLPFRATTATGEVFEIEFPLHRDTADAVRVSQLVTTVLAALDKDIAIAGETGNGDVLQALAMVTAIRAGMIHAPHRTVQRLSHELLATALEGIESAERRSPPSGHA